jgi:hypothetical protein
MLLNHGHGPAVAVAGLFSPVTAAVLFFNELLWDEP